MEFRIADTFTASLARLNGQEQKAVKITAVDLQLDQSSPGLHFHRIDNSKDTNFWSLRVNSDLRIIVHRTAGSILLCYVDHHDKAYAWAERRRIEAHPRTGTIQIVEIRERIEEIAPMPFVTPERSSTVILPRRPFDGLMANDLLELGVPVDWIETIRAASEDTFLDIADHLPPEAAEALLEYAATGIMPVPSEAEEAPLVVVEGPLPEVRLDFSTSPDTLRRFRVVENVEALEAALAYPWERWTVFLHPSQREIVDRTYSGAARVAGSAGTGKTVVALHRAARLAEDDSDSRILLTTYSRPLAKALEAKLKILLGGQSAVVPRISIAPVRQVADELHQLVFGHRPRIASDQEIGSALGEAANALDRNDFAPRFLASEWSNVVDAWQIDTAEAYAEVPRLGRKSRLGQKQRDRLWPVFADARRRLRERRLKTWAQVFGELAWHYADRAEKPFTNIVVDEAQDLGIPELKLLAAIARPGRDALFFAGDLGQRIFQQPFSWKGLGVDVRGRSETLKVNYRTSHQIRRTADRLLPRSIRDVDGVEEGRSGTVSIFNGPEPAVAIFGDQAAEISGVAGFIQDALADGMLPAEIGVFVRTRDQLVRARAAVVGAGQRAFDLSEDDADSGDRISVGTMHLAKGLEYRAVIVMACDDDLLPLASRVETVADEVELDDVYETERQLFYVACTRARDRLFVSGVEPGSEFLGDLLKNPIAGKLIDFRRREIGETMR